MRYPDLREEKKLWTPTRPPPSRLPASKRAPKGFKRVVGLDEAGRGPLAGPVVAAAVMIKPKWQFKIQNLFMGVKDSKKLTPKKREEFYKLIVKSPFLECGIGKVSEKVIDKINILEATKLAMIKAIRNLEKKYSHGRIRISRGKKPSERFSHAGFLILDGNFKLNLPIPQKSIVKADEKVFSCALASIIAKVTRDRIMQRYHKKYSQYGFNKHKGYPTKLHRRMLKRYGPCKIHRMSFRPVKINSKS